MNTHHLSEDDISVKYVTPALHNAGWDEETQIRRQESFTKGRIFVSRSAAPAEVIEATASTAPNTKLERIIMMNPSL